MQRVKESEKLYALDFNGNKSIKVIKLCLWVGASRNWAKSCATYGNCDLLTRQEVVTSISHGDICDLEVLQCINKIICLP